ncbi:MAG: hypothetical protein LQ341_002323 [Variospora aurantia]|nr:MAG: hypothetical protein LQ341_002323 [Variospora aurantia]
MSTAGTSCGQTPDDLEFRRLSPTAFQRDFARQSGFFRHLARSEFFAVHNHHRFTWLAAPPGTAATEDSPSCCQPPHAPIMDSSIIMASFAFSIN